MCKCKYMFITIILTTTVEYSQYVLRVLTFNIWLESVNFLIISPWLFQWEFQSNKDLPFLESLVINKNKLKNGESSNFSPLCLLFLFK